jgi:hypothetical protein
MQVQLNIFVELCGSAVGSHSMMRPESSSSPERFSDKTGALLLSLSSNMLLRELQRLKA